MIIGWLERATRFIPDEPGLLEAEVFALGDDLPVLRHAFGGGGGFWGTGGLRRLGGGGTATSGQHYRGERDKIEQIKFIHDVNLLKKYRSA